MGGERRGGLEGRRGYQEKGISGEEVWQECAVGWAAAQRGSGAVQCKLLCFHASAVGCFLVLSGLLLGSRG